ncbi:LPD38 domain-containing protein [Phocaeicola coprophilus]|uniref:LPD38 domain-containing protein n=1 Tax=Phocaeicola coprophilus TaxID=387090 RepID=UPI0039F4FCBB
MEDNKTRVLYDRLTQDGYDIGDFDSFSKNVQDEAKRKSLYETITNDGYDVGDFDSFSSKLVARSQEEPVTNVTTQNVQPEQPQVQPVQDMPSYDPKTQGYILENVPDMFRSKGDNLATRPLPQQDLFENNPSNLVRKIGIDQQQRVEQAQKSANDPYMKEQNLELFKRQNQEQINSVNELINAARQERAKERQQRVRSVGDGGIFSTMSQAYLAGEQNDTDKQLEYASTLMEQAQNITNEAKKKGNTNFFAGFARGFKDAPLDGWAMGLQDLKNYSAAKKVMDKVDKGEELTPSEDALMQALVTNAATQMYYAGDLGRGYKAGGVTAESLPFMLDMIAGMGAVQALTKPASKAIVKYAADKAAQMGLGRATTGLAKGAARTVAGLGDVAAHTATFGSARVAADYQRRGLGDVQVKPNADGTVSYDGRENVQTGAEALGKSIISTAAETGSELLGEYFAPMLGYIGRVTGANKIGKIIPASVGKAFKDVVNSQGFREMQEIARRAKISDPLGEYAEEVANNLVSTAIGDMTPEQLVDLDQNIDTFLGVAPMSALFGAAGTGGYLRDKYKNYRNMRNFESQMQDAMGEDWSGVREALQDADIETARNMVKDVLSSPMSPDMKKNAIKYISSVLQEQTLQEADKQMMPEEIAVEKRNIINNLNETRSKISLNDEELNAIINSEEGYQAIISQFDPETANNIMQYKQAYDDFVNYNYWVQDQADNARRQAEAQVESLTNATTGTIMRVNSGLSTNPVNVLRGNLVFDNAGKVDENQSDKTIYYMSEDGRVKMAPVSMFSSLVDNTPAEEMIQRAGNDAQEEVLQAEEAQINSIPAQEQQPIGPETRFTMGGNDYEVNRVTPDGYEVYLLDENGTPAQSQLMSEEEIRNAINGHQPANAEETQPSVTEQPVQEETSEQPVQENQTAMSRIPLNERGEQDFEAAPVADTSAALLEISDNVDDAKDTATQMIDHYNNELKKAEKAKSTGNTIQEIVKMKQEKKANIKAINDKISYWNQVAADLEAKRPTGLIAQAEEKAKENQQRLASMTAEEQQAAQQEVQKKIDAGAFERKEPRKKVRYVKEDADLGPSITPQEHVLREIATGRVSFSLSDTEGAQGLSSHLGYSNSPEERKKLVWALSSDGLTPEAAAEQIHADMPEDLQGMVTDQDVFNMIINAFQEYGSPSKMWDAAKNMHGTDIEENIPGYEEDQERQLIEWEASENRMSVPEWIAYSDYIEEELNNLYSSVTDEELNTIFEQIINDYERRAETESAGSTEGQTDSEQGNTVQPERESDNEGRTGEVEEQPEPANKTDGESGSVVPEPEGTVDNNGYPFLKSSNETTIFGEIREETGLTPAPIKLSEGFNRKDEKGRNHGYGFKHIEESHGDQIRNYGFESIPEFVESVAKNYTIVRKGNKRNGIDTYILEVSDKKNNTLFVELSKDGSYWNVNSAGVFRKGYSKKKEVVWPLPAVEDASTAEDTGVQNAADSSNSMSGNSPQNTSFVDKDTQSLEEKQEDKQKFTASEINQGEGVIEYAQRIAKEKEIWDESQKVDINPAEGQKEAGNYKMGHVKVDGMDITIENPKGSVRSGKDANGKEWSVTMNNTYGYIRGTRGVDGDHIDIFLSDNPESGNVYVIDQVDQQTGMYDESKVMYGFNSIDEARDAYLANYEKGWKVGVISEVSKEEFKKWIESSTNKIKPFSEYAGVEKMQTEDDGTAKDLQPKENVVAVSEMENTTNIEKELRFRETDVSFSDFAAKHKLNEADVKKYAQSMRNGNLGGASYAFKSIQRSIRLQNENLPLGQFVKVFSPIKKELYAKFGDIDSLREEYIQREIEERNMMEAAKKRIEEEKKAENERLLEFENMSDQEMDEAYFKALENNDKSRMRDIVNESARRKGYMSTGEFRMSHRAPSYDEEGIDKSMIDVANNKDNIRDSLNEQMRMNQDKNRKESVNAINNALSSIEKDGKAMVTIYRAVPKSIKESNVRNGDWVTLSESYAKQHGNHALEGSYRIIKEEVPAENLYWDGNDINEWGYDDRNDYRYKDTKNNRKLNDLVTRDDNGNIIPPSKRFNSRKKDTRFRFIGEQGAANLDAAEEANTRLDNLAVAREMEKSGKDAKSIKIATGWERGADNKWRYETYDGTTIFQTNPDNIDVTGETRNIKSRLSDIEDEIRQARKNKNSDKLNDLFNEDERLRSRLANLRAIDFLSSSLPLGTESKNMTLRNILDYDSYNDLLKAYPELSDVKVTMIVTSSMNDTSGAYNKNNNEMTLSVNEYANLHSTFVHELQHIIQGIEGFASGGNTQSVVLSQMEEVKEKMDQYKDVYEEYIMHRDFDSDDYREVMRHIRWANDILEENKTEIKEYERLKNIYDDLEFRLIQGSFNEQNYQEYRRVSGEVEARNVQSRINLNEDQRRNTLASETEDVSRKDQIFIRNGAQMAEHFDNVSKNIKETSKKLNVPVEVITSVDQIKDNSVRSAIEKGRKVKGWYSLSDNKVYVYLPNATSMEDMNQTVLHEGVAHYGLRQLVGEERMDDFLDDVFANVTDEVRKKIIDTLPRYGYNSRIATEEYMARMAENGVDVSVWQRIKQAFNSLMRRMGINIKISDNELRYILWRSRQNLDKNKPLDLAKDVAMQYQMGVGNYFREDTDGSIGMYEQSLKGWKYKAQEAYQDSMLALKNLQEVIAKVSGKPIKSFENAYMAENQLSSKNTSEAEVYYKKHYQPMLQEAGKMMKKYGLTQKGIERYMMLSHGIERNVELTFREQLDEVIKNNPDDADQFIKDFKDEKERLRKLYSGYEYLKELSDYIGGVNDYSATQAILNSMDGEEHDNFQEDALNYVKDFEQTYDVKELWNKTNDATKTTLRKAYDSGMMGKEQYSNVNNMYMYYVPLRGWDEQTAEDVYEYIDSERNPVSSVLKSAKGRKSIPDEIFATIGNVAESAIMQGNRNMMKQSFMSMVINHPTDIATLKKAWYVYDPVKDEWNISMPDIQESDNAETIAEKLKNHEEQMKQLKENGLATQKPNGLNINYRINKNNISQHVVQVKNGGKDYVIYINGNPRAAQAINGLTNPNVEQNPIFRSIATANRWLAANFTTRNPAFVLSNLVRDLIFSNVAVSIKEDGKYSSRFRKNILKAMPVVLRNLNGKPNNTEADRYFQEFIENGGETGYMHLNDVEKYKKKVRKELSKINGEMGSAKMAMDFAIDRLEDFNRWAEDISRFTTYMTSRQMGRSITESVNDAKEVTVNFNKKGAGYKTGGFFGITSGIFRNLYLFFNASVQSLTNFKRLYDKQPAKFYSALGGFMSAGFLMPMINNVLYSIFGGGDDDPYNDLPEWVRRNNLCIYTGNDTFLTIPLPIELRAFYGLGDYAYQLTTGKEKPSATNIAKGTVGQLADLLPLNPTGNEGLKTFMPDIMSPIFEAYVWNKDFTGKPVAKISPFNERDPEWKRVYKGTSGWLVDTSKFLNDISNGSGPGSEFRKGFIDFNPAKVEHLLESYFGGMAKTFNQAGKTIYYGGKSLIEQQKDEDLVMRNVPIVNRFLNTVDERNVFSGINTEYFNLRDEMDQFKYELNGVKKSGNKDEYKEMLNSDLYDKYQKYKPYQKKLKKLNDMAKESQGEDRKEIEDMIIETRRELLEEVK